MTDWTQPEKAALNTISSMPDCLHGLGATSNCRICVSLRRELSRERQLLAFELNRKRVRYVPATPPEETKP